MLSSHNCSVWLTIEEINVLQIDSLLGCWLGLYPDDHRSTSGLIYIFLGPNRVSWCSKKQPTVLRSSTETEFCSLASTVAELTWLQSLFLELYIPSKKVAAVRCENLNTVHLVANLVLHAQTKHVELDLYYIQEKVAQRQLEVKHLPVVDQLANILTKDVSNA